MSRALFSERRVLWMPLSFPWTPAAPDKRHCCDRIGLALDFDCDMHADPFECADTLLVYHEPFDEYGLPIRDGGTAYVLIDACPFCTAKLPPSRREDWFDAVEAAGHAPDEAPEAFLTDEWRRG